MAASNWLRDGAEATRRRQRTLFVVATSIIAIPATILTLATVVARADSSSRPLAVDASVSGTVTRASDDTGVNEAVVSARSPAGLVFTALSAPDGTYSFSALPSGDYIFHAATTSTENLAGRFSGGATTQARASTITLTDGASLSAVDFSLEAAGGISGFVTDVSDDSAVPDVKVTAPATARVTAISAARTRIGRRTDLDHCGSHGRPERLSRSMARSSARTARGAMGRMSARRWRGPAIRRMLEGGHRTSIQGRQLNQSSCPP